MWFRRRCWMVPGEDGSPAAVANAVGGVFTVLLAALLVPVTSDDVQDFQKFLPDKVVWAVTGQDAELPCNVTPSSPDDRVNMVLWFKDSSVPLYSLDARGGDLAGGVHWATADDLGARAHFQAVGRQPAVLRVHNVSLADEGIFRCRIDFRNSPTINFRINLTIVVPPSMPTIYDLNDREVGAIAGPFLEGYDLKLACKVRGGRPRPEVTWWQSGRVRDASVDAIGGGETVNRLFIQNVSRSLWNSYLECQATSSSLMRPLVRRVQLDVYLRPQGVRLLTKDRLLSVGQQYRLQCETWGSVPAARVTWVLDGEPLRSPQVQVEHDGNVTLSTLLFRPHKDDQQKEIACRVENPHFPGGIHEDRQQLYIAYAPSVSVKLAPIFGRTSFKEGETVQLLCEVKSNPEPDVITWYHGERAIRNSTSSSSTRSAVATSARTLVLANVSRTSAGLYSCGAANSAGESRSSPVLLRVQYAPRCKPGHEETRVGALKHDTVSALCEVDAEPGGEDVRFSWTLQRGRDVLPLPASRVASRGASSELRYTPVADADFGTLACWAANSVGQQDKPCLFHIQHARPPQPPEQCSVHNDSVDPSTVTSDISAAAVIEVWCSPGDDGGLAQHFVLEVRPSDGDWGLSEPGAMSDQAGPGPPERLIRGATPRFTVTGLRPGARYSLAVYAENRGGRSQPPVLLSRVAAAAGSQGLGLTGDLHGGGSSSGRRGEAQAPVQPMPVILAVIVSAAALVVVGIFSTAAFVICRRRRLQRQLPKAGPSGPGAPSTSGSVAGVRVRFSADTHNGGGGGGNSGRVSLEPDLIVQSAAEEVAMR